MSTFKVQSLVYSLDYCIETCLSYMSAAPRPAAFPSLMCGIVLM